jgi:hypothetical protein
MGSMDGTVLRKQSDVPSSFVRPFVRWTLQLIKPDNQQLGLSVTERNGDIYVKSVLPGSPVEQSGLHKLDLILQINECDMRGQTKQAAIELLKSSSTLNLLLQRNVALTDLVAASRLTFENGTDLAHHIVTHHRPLPPGAVGLVELQRKLTDTQAAKERVEEELRAVKRAGEEGGSAKSQLQAAQESHTLQAAKTIQIERERSDAQLLLGMAQEELAATKQALATATEERDAAHRLAKEREKMATRVGNELVKAVTEPASPSVAMSSGEIAMLRDKAKAADDFRDFARQQIEVLTERIREQTDTIVGLNAAGNKLRRETETLTNEKATLENAANELREALAQKDKELEEKDDMSRKLRRQALDQRKADQDTISSLSEQLSKAQTGHSNTSDAELRQEVSQLRQKANSVQAKLNAAEARSFDLETQLISLQVSGTSQQQSSRAEEAELVILDPAGVWQHKKKSDLLRSYLDREKEHNRVQEYLEKLTNLVLDKAPNLLQELSRK